MYVHNAWESHICYICLFKHNIFEVILDFKVFVKDDNNKIFINKHLKEALLTSKAAKGIYQSAELMHVSTQ